MKPEKLVTGKCLTIRFVTFFRPLVCMFLFYKKSKKRRGERRKKKLVTKIFVTRRF